MVSRTHRAFKADDRSYFALLKKEVHAMAVAAGMGARRVAEADIVVAEMTSNLFKHATGGELWVKSVEEAGIPGLELLSVDKGPGIADINRMLADGVSTKQTLGQGLGAMKRLSDVFQVYSAKGWGTVLLSRVFDRELPYRRAAKVEIRNVVLPKPGEVACGDGFFCRISDHHIRLFLGDGLGHGPEAEAAVLKAGEAFDSFEETDPSALIRHINASVRKTRGLVGTAAVFDLKARQWQLCGVGNIITRVHSPSAAKNYLAYNGIIGLNVPNTLNVQTVPYEPGQQLILCSDGLKSRWDAIRYGGIQRQDLTLLAASLLKDYARLTDDMSVAVCKINL